MKNLSRILLAATVVAGGALGAAPSFAAAGGSTGVLSCDSGGNSQDLLNQSRHELAQQLQLRTKPGATIDEWNGCFKVQYTDDKGHTVVGLYDPSTLNLVNQLS